MLKIIVINGSATNGKDSFANLAQEHLKGGFVISHSTVGTVKKAAELFGANEKTCKGEAERRLWSDMKDAWTRYCDGPFKEIVEKVSSMNRAFDETDRVLLFVHCREPEEIQKVKDRFPGQCITVLIRGLAIHVPDNHADRNVENYQYDVYIENDGTLEDLSLKANAFVESLVW